MVISSLITPSLWSEECVHTSPHPYPGVSTLQPCGGTVPANAGIRKHRVWTPSANQWTRTKNSTEQPSHTGALQSWGPRSRQNMTPSSGHRRGIPISMVTEREIPLAVVRRGGWALRMDRYLPPACSAAHSISLHLVRTESDVDGARGKVVIRLPEASRGSLLLLELLQREEEMRPGPRPSQHTSLLSSTVFEYAGWESWKMYSFPELRWVYSGAHFSVNEQPF